MHLTLSLAPYLAALTTAPSARSAIIAATFFLTALPAHCDEPVVNAAKQTTKPHLESSQPSAEEALKLLKAGNTRFANGASKHPHEGKDWRKKLATACSNGIDIYFDNVGGSILENVLFQMNINGRIVCCGAVSQYDGAAPSGPRNLPGLLVVKRLRMEGFIALDFPDKDEQAIQDLKNWVAGGQIKVIEDIYEGLEQAPAALIGLLSGNNRGKRLVRVHADPVKQS